MGRKLLDLIPKDKRESRTVKYLTIDGKRSKCYLVCRIIDVQLYKTAHSADLRTRSKAELNK